MKIVCETKSKFTYFALEPAEVEPLETTAVDWLLCLVKNNEVSMLHPKESNWVCTYSFNSF